MTPRTKTEERASLESNQNLPGFNRPRRPLRQRPFVANPIARKRLPAVDSNHATTDSKSGVLPLDELASVGSEGLEPSPLRVKAAFSATRDPSPSRSARRRRRSAPDGRSPAIYFICRLNYFNCLRV